MLQELLCFTLQVLTLSSWRTAAALHLLLTGQAHSCLLAPMTCAFPASEGAWPPSAARVPATTHRRCRAAAHGGCSAASLPSVWVPVDSQTSATCCKLTVTQPHLVASLPRTHLAIACASGDLLPAQLRQLPLHADSVKLCCRSNRASRARWEEL